MPNEPCGGDLCISPTDLKMMGQRIGAAERDRDSLRGQLATTEQQRNRLQAELDDNDIRNGRLAFEIADLKGQIFSLTNQRDSLRGKLEEAEAACAEMRGVLEAAQLALLEACKDCEAERLENTCAEDATCNVWQTIQQAEKALSSSCGKAMLERVKHLEQAEGLLRKVTHELEDIDEGAGTSGTVVSLLNDGLGLVNEDDQNANLKGVDYISSAVSHLADLRYDIDAYLNPKPPHDDSPCPVWLKAYSQLFGSDNPESPGSEDDEPKEGEKRA